MWRLHMAFLGFSNNASSPASQNAPSKSRDNFMVMQECSCRRGGLARLSWRSLFRGVNQDNDVCEGQAGRAAAMAYT